MFDGVEAGAARGDDSHHRQRNIFPLPEIPSGESGGPDDFWRSFANQGIKTLNELCGIPNSNFHLRKKPTRAQRRVTQIISEAYKDAYHSREVFADCGGLGDICSSSRLYDTGRSVVQPYARELVSWPEVSTQPVPLADCVSSADQEWLGAWQTHMLKNDAESVVNQVKPYVDPIFRSRGVEYKSFLLELRSRSMLDFRIANGEEGQLGVFFVAKKSGKLRLIFDTRRLNQSFRDPPNTDLPSADAFARLETCEGEPFFVGSGDLQNAFYTLGVPPELGRMFTLPSIEAKFLGFDTLHGEPLPPGARVLPFLTVLPMGWSWALHLCQSVIMNAIQASGFSDCNIVGDKRPSVRLHTTSHIAAAGYVDNFAVIGSSPELVNQGLQRISSILRSRGLTVHEEEAAQSEADFVGLHFSGNKGYLSLKSSRICKLKCAIDELLSQQFCSGRALQVVVGHITWAMMCRREGLSILHSTYSFIHHNPQSVARLWPSVRKELAWVASLLPLFRMKLNCGWSDDVTASDSSPFGIGVCSRKLDVNTVKDLGGCSERWRFKFEDAMLARKHAISSAERDHQKLHGIESINDEQSIYPVGPFISQQGFNEVPAHVMKRSDWAVVHSRPWKFQGNILNTEARGLVWSVEHLLRANRCISKRLLCFSDNLPLVLGTCKGRARSHHLFKPLRQIAALSLATGSKISVRWVISELNVADAPSRAISAWQAKGLEKWWEDFIKEPSFDKKHKFSYDPEMFTDPHAVERLNSCSPAHSGTAAAGRDNKADSCGLDLPRSTQCQRPNPERLPETVEPFPRLVQSNEQSSAECGGTRRGSGDIPGRAVQGGERDRQCSADSRCTSVLLPSFGQAIHRDFAKNNQGHQGLEPCSTTKAEASLASRGLGGHSWNSHQQSLCRNGTPPLHSVHRVPETRGMFITQSEAAHPSPEINDATVRALGHPPPPSGRHDPRKNQCLRRFIDSGQRPLDASIPFEAHRAQRCGKRLVDPKPRGGCRSFSERSRATWHQRSQPLPVHTQARRGNSRHHLPEAVNARGETTGTLVNRLLPQAVREAGSSSVRNGKSAAPCSFVWPAHPQQVARVHDQSSKCSSVYSSWNDQVTKRMQRRAKARKKQLRSKLSGVQALKKAFRLAISRCSVNRSKVFLDLFCGDRGISKKLQRDGFAVVSVDLCVHHLFDLMNPPILRLIQGWISSGCVAGVWISPPNTSWSGSLCTLNGSHVTPLRDNSHIYGFSGLSFLDNIRIRSGNAIMRSTAQIVKSCHRFCVPCFLDLPATSLMWQAPPIKRLCCLKTSICQICDMCQYNARWRKRTRIQSWHGQTENDLRRICEGHGGICSRTKKHHISLWGQDSFSKQLWAHLAQPYPPEFAFIAAATLAAAADYIATFNLIQVFQI